MLLAKGLSEAGLSQLIDPHRGSIQGESPEIGHWRWGEDGGKAARWKRNRTQTETVRKDLLNLSAEGFSLCLQNV